MHSVFVGTCTGAAGDGSAPRTADVAGVVGIAAVDALAAPGERTGDASNDGPLDIAGAVGPAQMLDQVGRVVGRSVVPFPAPAGAAAGEHVDHCVLADE